MTVPHSSFDTRQLPPKQAWDLWHDQISVIFDSKPQSTIEEGFFAAVDAWLVGDAAIGRVRGGAQRFDRSRRKIAKDSMDGYVLQFYLEGQSSSRQGDYIAKPGDLYVLDMAQPLATSTTPHSQLSFVVPRRMLSPFLKTPDACHEMVLSADLPMVSLLRDAASSFVRNVGRMSQEDAECSLKPLMDLAAVAINAEIREEKESSVNLMLMASIRRHIDAHLLDPGLSADAVAASFCLSRRTLYRLFEPMSGFQAYVQERRLKRAWAALRAPEQRHLSISSIAETHGFANPENFTRAFRRHFAMTPREVRHMAGLAEDRNVSEELQALWSKWVTRIGS